MHKRLIHREWAACPIGTRGLVAHRRLKYKCHHYKYRLELFGAMYCVYGLQLDSVLHSVQGSCEEDWRFAAHGPGCDANWRNVNHCTCNKEPWYH
jgi:hypothetical protein